MWGLRAPAFFVCFSQHFALGRILVVSFPLAFHAWAHFGGLN